jgi:hypothetical protein
MADAIIALANGRHSIYFPIHKPSEKKLNKNGQNIWSCCHKNITLHRIWFALPWLLGFGMAIKRESGVSPELSRSCNSNYQANTQSLRLSGRRLLC